MRSTMPGVWAAKPEQDRRTVDNRGYVDNRSTERAGTARTVRLLC
ncbi:Uncharacterised protein [Amycolatopsis camponoti]|uniref:Uncharacterized protein n=1 Tax=Amycolatopsis camponoti TaxID=2606593 RepID=A0A6I8LWI9_9PSEU|nr:Uncharacterised protein [Amycolatopsis camponoti]